jgi:hypothetical protein
VEVSQVQAELRRVFTVWGRPGQLRVDNGYPWGSAGDLPTDLALWLLGLSVGLLWNPPRRPQHNGVVERFQGVGKNWSEPQTCADAGQLQRRLDDLDRLQREAYPYQGQRSRSEVFAGLVHSGRPYSRGWEKAHWSWEQMAAGVAQVPVPRRVDQSGRVSVYNRNVYVSKLHQGRTVYVHLDVATREWVLLDERGGVLRRQAADELSQENVLRLEVTNRR